MSFEVFIQHETNRSTLIEKLSASHKHRVVHDICVVNITNMTNLVNNNILRMNNFFEEIPKK